MADNLQIRAVFVISYRGCYGTMIRICNTKYAVQNTLSKIPFVADTNNLCCLFDLTHFLLHTSKELLFSLI